jgi:septal ring factor EnvC (AmiA/AmiB activator)
MLWVCTSTSGNRKGVSTELREHLPSVSTIVRRNTYDVHWHLSGAFMDPTYIIPAAIVGAMILLSAVAFGIWRLQSLVGALRTAKAQNDLRLAVEGEKSARIPGLEASLREKTDEANGLREAKASTEKELATLSEALSQTRQRLEHTVGAYNVLVAKLETAGAEKSALEGKLSDKAARLEETSGQLNQLNRVCWHTEPACRRGRSERISRFATRHTDKRRN